MVFICHSLDILWTIYARNCEVLKAIVASLLESFQQIQIFHYTPIFKEGKDQNFPTDSTHFFNFKICQTSVSNALQNDPQSIIIHQNFTSIHNEK